MGNTGKGELVMDYKKASQELFEMVLSLLVRYEQTEDFNLVCSKYPLLLKEYEQKMEARMEHPSRTSISD